MRRIYFKYDMTVITVYDDKQAQSRICERVCDARAHSECEFKLTRVEHR